MEIIKEATNIKQGRNIRQINYKHRINKVLKHFWKDKILLLMFLPVFLYILIFSYFPMYGIVMAFQDYQIGDKILGFDGSVEWVDRKSVV